MNVIRDSISRYSSDFENVRDDIISGIEEGVKEGIKEGIKKGFLDGIKDCLYLGFFNIDKHNIKSFKKILVDTSGNASRKSVRSSIKKIVRSKYEAMLDPSFKKYMEKSCNNMIEKLRQSKTRLDSNGAKEMKDFLSFSTKKISGKFEEISNEVRKRLPTDIIFGSAVDGIQEGFEETFNENIKTCEERIDNEIDNKVTYAAI